MLEFLQASDELQFEGRNREEVDGWVSQTLREQGYRQLDRSDRGMVHRFMEKMTGLSRAQITRLVSQYLLEGEVKAQRYRRRRFPTMYTAGDVELLAGVDEAHETLSGPATQKILQRVPRLRRPALPTSRPDLGRATVPAPQEPEVPQTSDR